MLTQLSLSALRSDADSYNLDNTKPLQSQLVLANGGSLNFNSLLNNVVDVKTKNYSIFYLTDKVKLSETVINTPTSLDSYILNTTLSYNNSYVSLYNVLSTSSYTYNNTYSLAFSALSSTNCQFMINIADKQYCTISYNDGVGDYFAVVDANNLITLKRGVYLSNSENVFNYIIDSTKFILMKKVNGVNLQFTYTNSGRLSGAPITSYSSLSSLTIQNNPIISSTADLQSTNYIRYTQPTTDTSYLSTLNIDIQQSLSSLPNNYLLYKNLQDGGLREYKVITLKNQISDAGICNRGDNLVLSASNTDNTTNLRNYTAIFSNISTEEDEGLELNYTFYNKSIQILPGLTYFKTEKSLLPFTQININDTSFSRQGAFACLTPLYADKVYSVQKSNTNTNKELLCTWLFGDIYNNDSKKVWVDRYYYPDLITKQQALNGKPIFDQTYSSYIENLVFTNANLLSTVKQTQYFDKISDFTFRPDLEYIYDRVNFNSNKLFTNNEISTADEDYYIDVNTNGGLFLAFDINNYTSSSFYTIKSSRNEIDGGLEVSFDSNTINFNCLLYNPTNSTTIALTGSSLLPPSRQVSLLINIDTNKGTFKAFVDSKLVVNATFTPALYTRLLYGDILANDTALISINNTFIYDKTVENYINNIFIHTSPFSEEDIMAFAVKQSRVDTELFYISLPCSMRNNIDVITQLNSFNSNQKSKSGTIDVYVSNLSGINTNTKAELQQYITNNIQELLPITTNLKNINIL